MFILILILIAFCAIVVFTLVARRSLAGTKRDERLGDHPTTLTTADPNVWLGSGPIISTQFDSQSSLSVSGENPGSWEEQTNHFGRAEAGAGGGYLGGDSGGDAGG